MLKNRLAYTVCVCVAVSVSACASNKQVAHNPSATYDVSAQNSRNEEGAFANTQVRWALPLLSTRERNYVPVEKSTAALSIVNDRIYIGSSTGKLLAFSGDGQQRFAYRAHAAIDSQPSISADSKELYVTSVDGRIHALNANTGELRWKENSEHVLTSKPVLSKRNVYVVSDDDAVIALSRDNGEVLWSYERKKQREFSISGHAGLVLHKNQLYTAFTDGSVVALDPTSGVVLWETDTSLDVALRPGNVPTFTDVDTTPAIIGERLYVASFEAGLYTLDKNTGRVIRRDDELTGIVSINAVGNHLLLASAYDGVRKWNPADQSVAWQRHNERGAPSVAVVVDPGLVLVGESRGSFFALDASDGAELMRLESGYGFSAKAAGKHGLGIVMSNGGTILCFSLPTPGNTGITSQNVYYVNFIKPGQRFYKVYII